MSSPFPYLVRHSCIWLYVMSQTVILDLFTQLRGPHTFWWETKSLKGMSVFVYHHTLLLLLDVGCGYNCWVIEGLLRLSSNTRTRGHTFKLEQHRSRLGISKYSFTYIGVKIWNRLPHYAIKSSNIGTFKRRLDQDWMNQPLKYDLQVQFEFDCKHSYLNAVQEVNIQQEEKYSEKGR